ncbi:MAG: hypothetical protein HY748_13470 [Elusimicrobia bacterium]|nr:hypothetical protein [Elusimicrobiota bacterium]
MENRNRGLPRLAGPRARRDWRRENGRRLLLPALMALAPLTLASVVCAAGGKVPGRPADGLAFLFGVGAGLTAFVVWARAVFARAAAEGDERIGGLGRWKPFWVGLLNLAVVLVIAHALGGVGRTFPPVALLALALLAAAALVAFRGAMALWPEYGYLALGPDAAPLRAAVTGGAMLTGMLIFFPVGTAFFAYAVVRSLGIGVLLSLKKPEKA